MSLQHHPPDDRWTPVALGTSPPYGPVSTRIQGTALVPWDTTELREQLTGKCRREISRLVSARADLENYRRRDLPEFRHWFHTRFARECSRHRRTEEEVLYLRSFVAEVGDEVLYGNVDTATAYRRILDRRNGMVELDAARPRDVDNDTAAEESLQLFSRLFEGAASERAANGTARTEAYGNRPRPEHARGCYRRLVRLLHPDLHPDSSPDRIELWHETQEAYRGGDIARLEILGALVATWEDLLPDDTSIASLMGAAAQAESRARSLERAAEAARACPAWRFANGLLTAQDLTRVRAETRARIGRENDRQRTELAELKKQISRLRELTRRTPKRAEAPGDGALQMAFVF